MCSCRPLANVSPVMTNEDDLAELAELVARLREQCDKSAPIVVLRGPRDVRNAVAQAFLTAQRFPDARLLALDVDLYRVANRGADITAMLGGALTALRVAVPPLARELALRRRCDAFRDAAAQERLAVLISNADSPAQVRALVPHRTDSTVVVTSSRSLAGLTVGHEVVVFECPGPVRLANDP